MSETKDQQIQTLQNRVDLLQALMQSFSNPVSTARQGASLPEKDVMHIEVEASQWILAGVATGAMDRKYLENLPLHAVPSQEFLNLVEKFSELLQPKLVIGDGKQLVKEKLLKSV